MPGIAHWKILNCGWNAPDAYHDELLRQSDEMDRLGILTWGEWRDLRREADDAYLRAVAGDDYH